MATALFDEETLDKVRAAAEMDGRPPHEAATGGRLWDAVAECAGEGGEYLNLRSNWAGAPVSRVQQAVARFFERANRYSPDFMNARGRYFFAQRLSQVRHRLARHVGAEPEEIALVRNTTEALVTVLMGLRLEAGDEVLTTDQDYPTFLGAMLQREARDGVRVRSVALPTPAASPEALLRTFEEAVGPRTRAILLCHLYVSGQVMPVRRICDMAHSRGIEVIVDGALAFGHLPLELHEMGCDYYGASFYKFAYGPQGTGFLFVRRDRLGPLYPLYGSLNYLTGESAYESEDIRKLEGYGTMPEHCFDGVVETLDFHEAVGLERRRARLEHLKRYWTGRCDDIPGLAFTTPLSPELSSSLVLFHIDGLDPLAVEKHLQKEHRILIGMTMVKALEEEEQTTYRPNRLWVDAGVFTREEELDRFAEVLDGLARNGLPAAEA